MFLVWRWKVKMKFFIKYIFFPLFSFLVFFCPCSHLFLRIEWKLHFPQFILLEGKTFSLLNFLRKSGRAGWRNFFYGSFHSHEHKSTPENRRKKNFFKLKWITNGLMVASIKENWKMLNQKKKKNEVKKEERI